MKYLIVLMGILGIIAHVGAGLHTGEWLYYLATLPILMIVTLGYCLECLNESTLTFLEQINKSLAGR